MYTRNIIPYLLLIYLNSLIGVGQIVFNESLFSDAIRLALLYKYGGFYADLDVVVLKSISHLKNVIASDQGNNSL